MLQPADIFIDAFSCLASDLEWYRVAIVTDTTYKYIFTFAEAVYYAMAVGKSHKVAPFIQLHEDLNIKAVLQELEMYDSKVILLSLSIAGTCHVTLGSDVTVLIKFFTVYINVCTLNKESVLLLSSW